MSKQLKTLTEDRVIQASFTIDHIAYNQSKDTYLLVVLESVMGEIKHSLEKLLYE